MAAIVVGTSSWADPGFVKHWYPKGVAARDRLRFYAERFEVVDFPFSSGVALVRVLRAGPWQPAA